MIPDRWSRSAHPAPSLPEAEEERRAWFFSSRDDDYDLRHLGALPDTALDDAVEGEEITVDLDGMWEPC